MLRGPAVFKVRKLFPGFTLTPSCWPARPAEGGDGAYPVGPGIHALWASSSRADLPPGSLGVARRSGVGGGSPGAAPLYARVLREHPGRALRFAVGVAGKRGKDEAPETREGTTLGGVRGCADRHKMPKGSTWIAFLHSPRDPGLKPYVSCERVRRLILRIK